MTRRARLARIIRRHERKARRLRGRARWRRQTGESARNGPTRGTRFSDILPPGTSWTMAQTRRLRRMGVGVIALSVVGLVVAVVMALANHR